MNTTPPTPGRHKGGNSNENVRTAAKTPRIHLQEIDSLHLQFTRQTSSVNSRSSSRMRSASSSSPCMTAYSRDAPQKLRFGGEIRQRRTRRACKRPQASSRLIASIVSSLCGIAIVSTPSFLLHRWGPSIIPEIIIHPICSLL